MCKNKGDKSMKRLPSAEEQVMSVIWKSNESIDLKSIMNAANEKFDHDWKPQTVSTFLARLRKRGFLSAEKIGRYTYYTPIVEMADYKEMLLNEIEQMF